MATYPFTKTGFQGNQAFNVVKKVIDEVQEPNAAKIAFNKSIVEYLEKVINNVPDYDTGYKLVEAGNIYEIEHKFSSIPTRSSIYLSSVEEPGENDFVYELPTFISKDTSGSANEIACGVRLRHEGDGMKSSLYTADDTLFVHDDGWATGYVRVLLWR